VQLFKVRPPLCEPWNARATLEREPEPIAAWGSVSVCVSPGASLAKGSSPTRRTMIKQAQKLLGLLVGRRLHVNSVALQSVSI
jgi:hypothetical protein